MEINGMNPKKYLIVLAITCAVFLTGFLASNYLNNQKIDSIKNTEDQISLDILSSEAQYQLLEQSSCDIVTGSILSDELNTLADKLSYAESQEGFSSADVQSLKENYSLLEIKDYLLMQQIYNKCGATPTSILYFYSNKGNCTDCTDQGYVLTALRQEYPELRVYAFDYNLDLDAVKTLITLYHIPSVLPALVMNGKVYDGFQSIAQIQAALPSLTLQASSTASSTMNSSPTSFSSNTNR